jgi:hypothetical protein
LLKEPDMTNAHRAILTATACLVLCGCIYSNVRVPLSSEFRNTRTVAKSGAATTRSVAWLVAWGDAGLQKAAANGQLTSIEYADRGFVNIAFGLYMSNTTVVYGN